MSRAAAGVSVRSMPRRRPHRRAAVLAFVALLLCGAAGTAAAAEYPVLEFAPSSEHRGEAEIDYVAREPMCRSDGPLQRRHVNITLRVGWSSGRATPLYVLEQALPRRVERVHRGDFHDGWGTHERSRLTFRAEYDDLDCGGVSHGQATVDCDLAERGGNGVDLYHLGQRGTVSRWRFVPFGLGLWPDAPVESCRGSSRQRHGFEPDQLAAWWYPELEREYEPYEQLTAVTFSLDSARLRGRTRTAVPLASSLPASTADCRAQMTRVLFGRGTIVESCRQRFSWEGRLRLRKTCGAGTRRAAEFTTGGRGPHAGRPHEGSSYSGFGCAPR
jgi:hypothetical protein